MSPSTKKALRTGYQALLALVVIVPVLMSSMPLLTQLPAIVSAVALATKLINAAEDAGLIPAWLRNDVPATPSQVTSDVLPASEDLSGT